jgi:hypothetical protein
MVKKAGWFAAVLAGVIMVWLNRTPLERTDFYNYYYPFAQGCLECGFIPHFAQWVLWPIGLLPQQAAWAIWTAVTVAGFLAICWRTKANLAVLMLSFPMLGQVWLGQIDVVIAAGLALMMFAPSPWLVGLGLVLAAIKPQVAGVGIVVLFLLKPGRDWLKIAAIPVAVFCLSLVVYGLDWPSRWLHQAGNLPGHVWRMAAGDIWPVGLTLGAGAIIALRPIARRAEIGLLFTTIAAPWAGVYSWVVWLAFVAPWWALPLSYGWGVAIPLLGNEALRLAWVLPAAVFGWLVWEHRSNYK